MLRILTAALLLGLAVPAAADGPYRILRTVKVGGDGGFDYITADSSARRLYLARSGPTARLLAFDLDSLKQTGEIDGVNAHGLVVDPDNGHGFASSKPVTMFDPATFTAGKTIAVTGNPDGMVIADKHLYVLSHSSPNITAIAPADGSITGTLDLGGAPEESAGDGAGHLYVDLETTSAVAVVDTRTLAVTARYALGEKGGTPTGLALDPRSRVLFVACRNPAVMVMMNADTGAILDAIPIGSGNDGVVFNPATREAIASQGDGTLAIIRETGAGHFELEQTLATQPGARTVTLDSKTGHVFLMTLDYAPPPADAPPPTNGRIARGPAVPGSFRIFEVGR